MDEKCRWGEKRLSKQARFRLHPVNLPEHCPPKSRPKEGKRANSAQSSKNLQKNDKRPGKELSREINGNYQKKAETKQVPLHFPLLTHFRFFVDNLIKKHRP